MGKTQASRNAFERMALRIANDDIGGYRELMRGSQSEYASAYEAYIDKLILIKKQNKRLKNG